MRVVENKKYIPQRHELKAAMEGKPVKGYSPDFLADLASFMAGEKILPVDELEKQLKERIPTSFHTDSDGDYRLHSNPSTRYTKDIELKKRDWVMTQGKKLRNLQDFILSVPIDGIPGNSPLEKAANLVTHLSQQNKAGQEGASEGGDSLPIIADSPEESRKGASDLQDSLEMLSELDRFDKEFLTGDDEASEMDAFINMDTLAKNLLKVEQFLKTRSKLNFKPHSKLILDKEGDRTFYRSSRDMSDLPKVSKRTLLNRSRLAHVLISGEAKVAERYKRTTPNPFVTIIIDKSASMSDNQKSEKALGFLYYITKEVAAGNTLALFAFFEQSCYDFTYLNPEMDLVKWFKKVAKTSFDMGGTAVGQCALQALEEFDKTVEKHNIDVDRKQKHLVLVNDGQDSLGNFTVDSLEGAVLHSFILDNENHALRTISRQSGGQYFEHI